MGRVFAGLGAFLALMGIVGLSPAWAEEWVARHGACYEWDARWDVQQEPSGVWVGIIDFVHAGGPCSQRTNQVLTYETRAAIVGTDFFARRTMANVICTMHGTIRAIEVRGFELCSSLNGPVPFVLRFEPPERR